MIHFVFSEQDPRYLFLKFDTEEDELWLASSKKHKNLMDHINLVDPICYLATFTGAPYTQDFLFKYVQSTGQTIYYCAIGLWQEIYKFFKDNNVQFDGLMENQHFFKRKLQHSFEEFKQIVDNWGLKFTPRPYQYEAAYKILTWKQSVSGLATRAGKTLIAYIIFRYCIEYLGAKRMLMIVPSIDLVKQGFNDFNEYKEFFKTECVWGGGKLVESANLTIGTFQSLIKYLDKKSKKYNPHFYDGYDIVFVDETHRATAAQMKTIISQPFMKNVKIAFGMTGTIPTKNTIPYYCLKTLLGATIQEIKPRQLMDAGYISPVNIKQIRLHYKDKDKTAELYMRCAEYAIGDFVYEPDPKNPNKKKRIELAQPENQIKFVKEIPFGIQEAKSKIFYSYFTNGKIDKDDALYGVARTVYLQQVKKLVATSKNSNALVIERMLTHFMDERITYLCEKILPVCNKNTLILGHHTTYLQKVIKEIKRYFPNRHIELITGSVDGKKRDAIKQTLKEHNDCILVASYGVMSTGITLSNLCFGVLFESFKSNVVNMQSIGRGLGLSLEKSEYTLYDIIDVFDNKVLTNKIYLQGLAKIKIYDENRYKYQISNVQI